MDGDMSGAGSCLIHDFFGFAGSEQCLVIPHLDYDYDYDYDYDDGVDDGKGKEVIVGPKTTVT
jgi:hypothetical protein